MKPETKYAVENNLLENVDHEFALLPYNDVIPITAVKLFEGGKYETMIVLYSLISILLSAGKDFVKGAFQFYLKSKSDDGWDWSLYMTNKYNDYSVDWKLIVKTVKNLLPEMASSNVSYLADGVFID